MKTVRPVTDQYILVHCWNRDDGSNETHEFKSKRSAHAFAKNVATDIANGRGEWEQVTLEFTTKTTWEMR